MQNNEELVFLYTVNPRKVITGLSGVNAIRSSKSLFLTKEDVKLCLQKATVYRRFAAEDKIERVTVGNIDRLHRENYVSEEDWEATVIKEMSEGHGIVNDVTPDLTKNEEAKGEEDTIEDTVLTTPEAEPKEDSKQNEVSDEKQKGAVPEEIVESDDDEEITVVSELEEDSIDENEEVLNETSSVEEK